MGMYALHGMERNQFSRTLMKTLTAPVVNKHQAQIQQTQRHDYVLTLYLIAFSY